MKPTLLCYHLMGEKASKIKFNAMRQGILLRPVELKEYQQTLGALCGLDAVDKPEYQGEDFPEEMMVMAGFSDQLLGAFLQGLKRMKAASVLYKAVLTDTNRQWDSLTLHQELLAEREAVLKSGKPAHRPGKG